MDNPLDTLPKELRDKMQAAKAASSVRCPVCKAGIGKWCKHRAVK